MHSTAKMGIGTAKLIEVIQSRTNIDIFYETTKN